jgi:hypothetical protein
LGVVDRSMKDRLRSARDAEAAYLDAVLRVNGAKYLRLAHLRDIVGKAYPAQELELKAAPGEDPVLWLDFFHRVKLASDGKTYHLDYMHNETIETLLQTSNFDETVAASKNVLDHAILREQRAEANPALPGQPPTAWPYSTLVYVWGTGIVTGAAALAFAVIHLKNLPFFEFLNRYIW